MSEENKVYVEVPKYLKVDKYSKVIQKSADLATWLKYSPAAANQSAINYVFTAPSTQALLYEKILLSLNSVALDITLTNNITGGAAPSGSYLPFQNNTFALRDFPLHRLFNSVALTLGSSTLSIPLNDILDVYRTCAFDHGEQFDAGSFTSIKDELAGMYDLTDGLNGSAVNASIMTALGNWAAQNSTEPSKRAMMNIEKIVDASGNYLTNSVISPATASNPAKWPTAAVNNVKYTVYFSLVEPLMLPIFEFLKKEAMSLTHLSQFQLSFILADPTSMVSMALPNGITASVAWNPSAQLSQNNTTLFAKWITPPAGSDYSDICRPMYDLQRYITQAGQASTKSPNISYFSSQASQTQITSQTISLPVVPSKLVFAVKIPRSTRYGDSNFIRCADTFLPITNIKITLGNRSNLLSSADQQCLYLESIESGLKAIPWQSYRGWTPKTNFYYNIDQVNGATGAVPINGAVPTNYIGLGGAPLVIDVAKTLGLPSDLAVGVSAPISLQVNVNYIQPFDYVDSSGNISPIRPELIIIAANQSYFEIARNGASRITQGGVSQQEVAMVNSMGTETYDNDHVQTFAGGDFFGSIKEGLKNLAPIARKVINVADQGLKMAGYGFTGGKRGMKGIAM